MTTTDATTKTTAGSAATINSYQVTVYVQPWSTWGIFYAENRAEAERKARDYYCYVDEKIEILLVCGAEPKIAEAA